MTCQRGCCLQQLPQVQVSNGAALKCTLWTFKDHVVKLEQHKSR